MITELLAALAAIPKIADSMPLAHKILMTKLFGNLTILPGMMCCAR